MTACLNPGEARRQGLAAESGQEKASPPSCQHFTSVGCSLAGDESLPCGVGPPGRHPVYSGCGRHGIINSGSAITHL